MCRLAAKAAVSGGDAGKIPAFPAAKHLRRGRISGFSLGTVRHSLVLQSGFVGAMVGLGRISDVPATSVFFFCSAFSSPKSLEKADCVLVFRALLVYTFSFLEVFVALSGAEWRLS